MWNFNKTTLFILIVLMSICSGISIYLINWEVFETGEGIFHEIHLPIIFICIAFYFIPQYVKKVKETK